MHVIRIKRLFFVEDDGDDKDNNNRTNAKYTATLQTHYKNQTLQNCANELMVTSNKSQKSQ